jgi:hypothetical protein
MVGIISVSMPFAFSPGPAPHVVTRGRSDDNDRHERRKAETARSLARACRVVSSVRGKSWRSRYLGGAFADGDCVGEGGKSAGGNKEIYRHATEIAQIRMTIIVRNQRCERQFPLGEQEDFPSNGGINSPFPSGSGKSHGGRSNHPGRAATTRAWVCLGARIPIGSGMTHWGIAF